MSILPGSLTAIPVKAGICQDVGMMVESEWLPLKMPFFAPLRLCGECFYCVLR